MSSRESTNMIKNVINRHYIEHKKEYDEAAISVLESGWYITGNELKNFETEFAKYLGIKHVVGLANGLDALWIGLKGLGIKEGDEVLVQSNAYIATVMGITINGATPIFVEPNAFYNMDPSLVEAKITDKTKAILVTHLYGQSTDMDPIIALTKKYNLKLIEDCAQSQGTLYKGKMTGTFGDLACFSFYPTKNLGAFGDGGAIATPHDDLASYIRVYRNYGSEKRYYNQMVGINSRLDEIQAALLSVKLQYLNQLNEDRRKAAKRYDSEIINLYIEKPRVDEGCDHIYHQYVIRTSHRDALIKHLDASSVSTIIHYPIPPHLSEAYENLGYHLGDFPIAEQGALEILSLPMFDGITEDELSTVIKAVNAFQP